MRSAGVLAVSAVLLLAACGRREEAPPPVEPAPAPVEQPVDNQPPPVAPELAGFSHTGTFDAAGYYLPQGDIQVGNWRLNHMGVGAVSDFSQWERGDRAATFGPILFQFDDVTSPTQTNELGGQGHTVTVRVLPDAYSTDGKTMKFAGKHPQLGPVTFEGAFDQAALARVKAEGAGQQPVLTGTLTVGTNSYQGVSFAFWAGD